jgi:hypothetical protein
VPYVRTVKTASGATPVQIVYSSRRGSRDIEHIGSAHGDVELKVLKAAARQRLRAGQSELDLGLEVTEPAWRSVGGGPLPITGSRMGHLHGALAHAYRVLGFEDATGRDEVFAQLVLARIIEPVSELDSLRVLEEAGITAASYRTVKRRLPSSSRSTSIGAAPPTSMTGWVRLEPTNVLCALGLVHLVPMPCSGRAGRRVHHDHLRPQCLLQVGSTGPPSLTSSPGRVTPRG